MSRSPVYRERNDAGSSPGPVRPLTPGERTAIEARLSSLGAVQWVDDATSFNNSLQADGARSLLIGLGEPTITDDTALARVSLWCGNLCGTWLTYTLAPDAEEHWAVTGYHGPRAIS
jgi:hypothetical protein